MKRLSTTTIAVVLLATAVGCSRTQRVAVQGLLWDVGAHRDCVYDKQAIFCIPPTETKVGSWDLSKMHDIKTKQPTPRNVALLAISPVIVEIGRRAKAFSTYDASFSSAPTDYSLWDCTKTGKESPAITCTFLDGHNSDEIRNIDKAFAVHEELLTLTQVKMSSLCPTSRVGHEALGGESEVLLDPSRASYFTTLEYATENGHLTFEFKRDDGSLNEVKGDNLLWLPETYFENDSHYMSALVISHEMPCLQGK
jgi:hypothetical protein